MRGIWLLRMVLLGVIWILIELGGCWCLLEVLKFEKLIVKG